MKGREIFESNDYLMFAFMSRVMLTFNSPCSSNKIATSFSVWLIKRKKIKNQIFIILAGNELRSPSPRLSAWATQLRRNVATVASRWRHCVDLTGPGIKPQTSRTDNVRLATELTAGPKRKNYK